MAALTLGVSLNFGLSNETGGVVQSSEYKSSREKTEVKDGDGDVCAVAYYNPTTEQTIEIHPNSGALAGVCAASPGASLSVTNDAPSVGLNICEEVSSKKSNTTFQSMTIKLMNYPLIT